VLRGGAWPHVASAKVTTRYVGPPTRTDFSTGFRCVKEITPKMSQNPDVIFELIERIEYKDGNEIKSITKSDIDRLRDMPIRLGENDHIDGLTLINEKNVKIHVHTSIPSPIILDLSQVVCNE